MKKFSRTEASEKIVSYTDTVKIYKKSHLGRVSRTFGLKGLTMDIARGEIFGLLGLNGSGKTTAMKLLTGLLFPTSGGVSMAGFDPGSSQAKSRLGFLPELPYFYSYLTPAESLNFYGKLSGMDSSSLKLRVPEVLERTGLDRHVGKKTAEFSKGMLQRLGLAQALLHDPDVLVLDEPVSGLDPLAMHDIRTFISDLNKNGKTIFLSSHSISEVEKLCHRAAILVDGALARIVKQAEWESTRGGLEGIFVQTVGGREAVI